MVAGELSAVGGKLPEEIHLAPGTLAGMYMVRTIARGDIFRRQVVIQKFPAPYSLNRKASLPVAFPFSFKMGIKVV